VGWGPAPRHTHGVSGDSPAREAQGGGSEEPTPVAGIVVTLAGIAVMAALALAIEPLRSGIGDAISGDTADLRGDLRDLGFGGLLITFGLALSHVVVWYPAEILDAAAGYVYGFWAGLPLVMAGWLANGVLAYWVGRHAARPLLWRLIGEHRFERVEGMVEAGGPTLLLGMRLVPIVPFSLFSIAAGAARADFVTFVWTTAIGYLPLTAVFVYLGSRLETLSPNDPIVWIGAAILIALLLLTHRVHRQLRRTSRRAETPAGIEPRSADQVGVDS
jgi:uncharacterized membrane protein YdjX (TVP38/TMEM64 family)